MAKQESKDFATRDEVDRAIEDLTGPDRLRLSQFARWRMRILGRAAKGRDADDLLSEAVTATILGAEPGSAQGRRWNKQITFMRHLTEVMRSISSHWREQLDDDEPALESELVTATDEGALHNPLLEVADPQPDALRDAIAKEQLAGVMAVFKDDDDAILVLEGLAEGWSRSEFTSIGMSTAQYDAALKRIRYALGRER